MEETSASLLERIRDLGDTAAWARLVNLYTPLLKWWLRHHAPPQDAEDLVQEVLVVLARRLPEFRYDREQGTFRGWLRGILTNCVRNHMRSLRSVPTATGDSDFLAGLDQLEDPTSDLALRWDQAHDWHVLGGALRQIEAEFHPSTVRAFRRVVLEDQSPADVAAELGMSVNAVLVAKCRVYQRLRQEVAGLTD